MTIPPKFWQYAKAFMVAAGGYLLLALGDGTPPTGAEWWKALAAGLAGTGLFHAQSPADVTPEGGNITKPDGM